MLEVNKYGLSLHKSVTSAAEKYKSFIHSIYELIGTITVKREFQLEVKEELWDGKKDQDDANDVKLIGIDSELIGNDSDQGACCLQTFYMCRVFSCINGALTIARPNGICDKIIHL